MGTESLRGVSGAGDDDRVGRAASGEGPGDARGGPGVVLLTLVVGVVWLAFEFLLISVADPVFDPAEEIRRVSHFLPWQFLLFLGLGAGLALLARAVPAIRRETLFFATAGATLAFLCPLLLWGFVRAYTVWLGLPATIAVGAAVAVLILGLARLGAVLPERWRRAWPLAACTAWTIVWLPAMRRAAPTLALNRPDLGDAIRFFAPTEIALALAVGVMLLAAGAIARRNAIPAALLGVGMLVALGATLSRNVSFDATTRTPARADLPDVLVILIDTMRADHMGRRPDGTSLTPALDAVASESIRFDRAYSPSNKTATAMPAIMTGLSSAVVGIHLSPEAVTLASRLRDAGYATYGISANPLMSSRFGYERGFDQLLDPAQIPDFLVVTLLKLVGSVVPGPAYEFGLMGADLFYRPVSELRRRAIRIVDATPRPLFLYLHTMDVHGPYLPPKSLIPPDYSARDFLSYFSFLHLKGSDRLEQPDVERGIENLRQRYGGEVRFTDRELGLLVADLKARGRWDDMLVWIIADHGEFFGEHREVGHSGTSLNSAVTRVPMMLRLPKSMRGSARVVEQPVSTRDVVPTTLALLGLSPPETTFGSDLSGVTRGGDPPQRVIISEMKPKGDRTYSAVDGPWKLDIALQDEVVVRRALYDLANDPGENEDVADRHPAIAARLEASLLDRVAEEQRLQLGEAHHELDPLTTERLRALGYVD